jgi:hypothetical protein
MTIVRKLVWNEETQQWTCSKCAWVFEPSDLFADKSLNKYFDVVRRDEEFEAHICADITAGGEE